MKVMKMKAMLFVCMAVFAGNAFAAITAGSNYVVKTFYANPHDQETIAAFDWDNESNLYYLTGRPDWGVGLSFYRYDDAVVSNLYTDTDAFSGGRVTAIGGRIYFKDLGTYERLTSDYYRYDPAQSAEPVNIGVESDLYGLATRDGTDFWAAGGWSAAIYYSTIDANGSLVSNPLVNLGVIGEASGPITFDTNGNLYYAEGYVEEGTPTVYRWTAAEVSAAIADPAGAPLSPSNHIWATLSSGSGASGMAVDDNGNLLVTATSFIEPSELQRLFITNGVYLGYEVLASSDDRLETVRVRDGEIYFNSPEGIFTVAPYVPGPAAKTPLNDYTGDGKSDIVVYNTQNGDWHFASLAQGYLGALNFGFNGAYPVPGDFDGDGVADLAVYHYDTGDWYIWLMAGQFIHIPGFGGPAFFPTSGDYTGDGKDEIVAFDYTSGDWHFASLTQGYLGVLNFGYNGTVPVPNDYDGDGICDLAVYDYNNGDWYIWLMAGQFIHVPSFGGQVFSPVSGDYTGDGKSEIVAYNRQSGDWHFASLAQGYLGVLNFGYPGAYPVPGNYDGDSISDLAVYDYKTGDWYIWLMAGQFTHIPGFGGQGFVPVLR